MKFNFFGREFDFFANEAQYDKFFRYLLSYVTPAVICAALVAAAYGVLLICFKKRKMLYHYRTFKRLQFLVPLFVLAAFKLLHDIGSTRNFAFTVPDMFAGSSYYHESVVLTFLINVILYTAYGYYIAAFFGKSFNPLRVCLTVVLTSLCIEVLQYVLASGNSSSLEVIASFIGAAAGTLLHAYNCRLFKRKTMRGEMGKRYESLF